MNYLKSSSMSRLPSEIITDIFLRLSLNTIGQSRCICKTWCDLLSDPYFINLHLSKSPSSLIINENRIKQSPTLNLVKIDDEPDHHFVHQEPARTWQHKERLYLVGSVNGLLCLWNIDDDDTYIFNPILREYILLPKHKYVRRNFQAHVSYGFGLCPLSNEYKVVRIFQGNHESDSGTRAYVSECEVYTLGTRAWRSVGNVSMFSIGINPAIFVNGGFHWLKTGNGDMIVRFDLEMESFKMVCAAPPLCNRDAMYLGGGLDLLGGCLCICDNSLDEELVIWVLKEYGVEESWTKEVVISRNDIPEWVGYEAISPVKILKDGSVLMVRCDDNLITYCPRTKTFKKLDFWMMSGYYKKFEAMSYVPSIISLKNIMFENVQVF